jgi:hypothetical protein
VDKFQKYIGGRIGELHVEHESKEAIIIRANSYYMDDSWFRYSGKSHCEIEAMGSIRSYYKGLL